MRRDTVHIDRLSIPCYSLSLSLSVVKPTYRHDDAEQIYKYWIRMNKSIATVLLLSVLLTACGGGAPAGPISASPTSVQKVLPTQGDYFTYSLTSTPTIGSQYTIFITSAYITVNLDGSSVALSTASVGSNKATANINSALAVTSYSTSGSGATTCTYAPSGFTPPFPLTIGSTWNYSFTQTCTGGSPSTSSFNYSGSMTALESVTTPAGTFAAGKIVATSSELRTGVYTEIINDTCWIDAVTGRTVKCNSSYVSTPLSGSATSGTDTLSLIGYSAAGLSSAPTVTRFAGIWSGSYTGAANSGTCSSLTVSSTGVITGSCVDINVGAFTVSGTVNVAGTVAMTASTGVTFSGTLSTTATGSGTWTGVPSGGGTWTATHL